ncbi:MAG: hypothetical protein WBG46_07450 [Nonlabens sp.]
MKLVERLIVASIMFVQCSEKTTDYKDLLAVDELPKEHSITFKQELVPDGKLIHRGILNPQLDTYYFTLSDKSFNQFDIYFVERKNGKWSTPKKTFFNSDYKDHGMSFSPDGNTIYFSSTRPVDDYDVADTWHIWKSV